MLVLLIGVFHSGVFAQDSVFDTLKLNRLEKPVEVPEFSLPSLSGKEMTLSDYKGSVVFLNFWTTW